MGYRTVSSTLVLVLLFFVTPLSYAEDALILSVGTLHLSHTQQNLAGNTTQFAGETSTNYDIAWEQRHYNGIAYGAEYLMFSDSLNQNGTPATATARLVMATLKKYHRPWRNVYPFIGVGAGLADTTLDHIPGRNGVGVALEVDGGVEVEWARSVGFYTELRALYAQPGDLYGTSTNVSGIGLYAGISLLF